MPTDTSDDSIVFSANKIYVHHWPLDTTKWSDKIKEKVDLDLHKNNERKKIEIKTNKIKIDDYQFDRIKKIGITVPLFKKETTMVFEANFGEYFAHVHITTKEKNYLDIFNRLMNWKDKVLTE